MTLLALILLQAATELPPIAFDLGKLKHRDDDCAGRTGGEIVVCARRSAPSDRMVIAPDAPERLPEAEMTLFGHVRGSLHTEPQTVGGFPSNRAMVTITIPF